MASPTGTFNSLGEFEAASQPAAAAPLADNPPFVSGTIPPAFTFSPNGGAGISIPGFYVTADDSLVIAVRNSAAGLNGITVQVRFMLPDGSVQMMVFPLNNIDQIRTKFTITNPLQEGIILGVTVQIPPVTVKRGQCYITAAVVRGADPNSFVTITLLSDYLTTAFQPSWPFCPIRPALEGPGFIYTPAGNVPNPAAGAQLVMPIRTQWRIISIQFSLTTDGTAGNRSVDLTLQENAGEVFSTGPVAVQPPNTTYFYSYASGVTWQTNDATRQNMPLPAELFLANQAPMNALIVNPGAGDQMTAMTALVEEWIDI
jgi:hypothetical protein